MVGGKTYYSVYLSDGELVHKREVDAAGNTVTESDLVRANGALVVELKDGVPEYTHTDHLGTVSTRTDASGLLTQQEYYTPYGEPMGWQRPGEQELGFTGHLKDKTTRLTYMQARHYDPVSGRFLSVDPVGFASIGDPRYVNRYSYAGNDPVNLIDPNGHSAVLAQAGSYIWRNHTSAQTKSNVHTALDVGGLTPAVGIFADAANAGLYAAEGDLVNTGISAAAMIPGAGQGVTAVKLGAKYGDDAKSAVSGLKLQKQLASEAQVADLASGGGTVISQPAKQAGRISAETGAESTNIQKVSSESFTANDGQKMQTQSFRDASNNNLVEPKTKIKE